MRSRSTDPPVLPPIIGTRARRSASARPFPRAQRRRLGIQRLANARWSPRHVRKIANSAVICHTYRQVGSPSGTANLSRSPARLLSQASAAQRIKSASGRGTHAPALACNARPNNQQPLENVPMFGGARRSIERPHRRSSKLNNAAFIRFRACNRKTALSTRYRTSDHAPGA
jgi:hypothetical protein